MSELERSEPLLKTNLLDAAGETDLLVRDPRQQEPLQRYRQRGNDYDRRGIQSAVLR